jgi:hypothetical protein
VRNFADCGGCVEISDAASGVQDRNVVGQFLFLPLRIGADNIDPDLVRFNFCIPTLRAR